MSFVKKIIFFVCVSFLFCCSVLFAQAFDPQQSAQDISAEVQFLVSSVMFQGSGDFMTTNALLPKSYYDNPQYWGGYVCGDWAKAKGINCNVTDTPHEMDTDHGYLNGGDTDASKLQLERTDVHDGADVYDAACWEIALALAAKNNSLPSVSANEFYTFINNQNERLMIQEVRGFGSQFQYGYQSEIISAAYAYLYRMLGIDFLSEDPFLGTEFESFIHYDGGKDDPTNANKKKYFGKTTWSDYKPITGENGWAVLLGPIQADRIRYQTQGYIPFKSLSIQNAMNTLYAFQRMQAENGALYYAPGGSLGNQGDITKGTVSTENCASSLAGLNLLRIELANTLQKDSGLTDVDQQKIKAAINLIDIMIWGGKSPMGDTPTKGLLNYFQHSAWDAAGAIFSQGGVVQDGRWGGAWHQSNDALAVDVSTWGIAVLGPQTVDSWFGAGAAYQAWQHVKSWGGYMRDGQLWGVGYTNDVAQQHIMSAEWTAGAINLVRVLINYYAQHPTASVDLKSLQQDELSMHQHLMALRSDNYLRSDFEDAVPSQYYVQTPKAQKSFLYASRRYMIPFGWYANPIPSTTSTSWAIYLYYGFNPFSITGAYDTADWSKPIYDPNDDRGPWNIGTDHHVTATNKVDGAEVMFAYNSDCGTHYQNLLKQPLVENGSASITIPADACMVSAAYNKTPNDSSSWYGACQLNKSQIDRLQEHQTVAAIWTNDQGNGECEI